MTTAVVAAGALIVKPQLIRGSQANSAIRIGLLGCGNRGSTVAASFVANSKNNCRVVAIADLFDDRLQAAKKLWDGVASKNGYPGIDPKLMFKGPKAFEQIANCDQCDIIILSSPDYFHPQHLEAVVDAGKHCYCEKPAGVDVEGCRKFIEIGKRAEGKISIDCGYVVRNAPCFSEVVERIHNGAIGKVSFGSLHYFAPCITYPDFPNASPLERRIRQFYWDNVLSGDTIVDQDIHVLDIANWTVGTHPEKAIGSGGRKVRQDASNIWDNWTLSFTYPDDVHMNFSAVQYGTVDSGNLWDVGVKFIGDLGIGEAYYNGFGRITGKQPWSSIPVNERGDFSAIAGDFGGMAHMMDIKASLFVESIISGTYHNQTRECAESALTAILGRMAAYSGEEVTWSEMMASNQSYQGQIDLTKL